MTLIELTEHPELADHVGVAEVPALLAEIEALRARLWGRLVAANGAGQHPGQADRRLNVEEAASKLGTSRDWLYRHARSLPFTVRIGRTLGFSELGIERYLRHRAGR